LTGINNGSTVPDSFVNFGTLLAPVKATQTELGYKHQLGGLLLQGAVFNIEQAQTSNALSNICDVSAAALRARFGQNAQGVTVGNQFCGITQSNGGKARFRGLELQASGDINRNFGVVISGMLMNATVLQDSTPNDPALFNGGFINIKGKTPGNTPKETFSLFGEYRPDALPGLGVNAGLYFTGRRPVNTVNSAYIGGQTLFALGARYRTQIGATAASFQLNVENAANKSYWASGDTSNAPQLVIAPGLPRMIKASAKFDF
jgi:iron complex outermembrane receptor protein